MPAFIILLILVAIALVIIGAIVKVVQFLFWIALALVLIAVIMWALRSISGKNRQ